MKKQILIIHGGDAFKTYEEYLTYLRKKEFDLGRLRTGDWKSSLAERLGEDFEVIFPRMPNWMNAKYQEWKIWLEKIIPFLQDEVVLIGHSMGGIFLAKYLSENDFPKKIRATFLVSAPYDDKDSEYSLVDFALEGSLERFKKQEGEIFLYYSEDDPAVPFRNFEQYKKELPDATERIFKDRGHFQQEELPEIVQDIKSL